MTRLIIKTLLLLSLQFSHFLGSEGLVRGKAQALDSFPYHVSIQDQDNKNICGGAIISAHYVLTSDLCVLDKSGLKKKTPIKVVAGTINLFSTNFTKIEIYVERVYLPKINKEQEQLEYLVSKDIALLKLKGPLPLNNSSGIKAARLPDYSTTEPHANFTGFNLFDTITRKYDGHLRYVQMKVLKDYPCQYKSEFKSVINIDPEVDTENLQNCEFDLSVPVSSNGFILAIASRQRNKCSGDYNITEIWPYLYFISTAMSYDKPSFTRLQAYA